MCGTWTLVIQIVILWQQSEEVLCFNSMVQSLPVWNSTKLVKVSEKNSKFGYESFEFTTN